MRSQRVVVVLVSLALLAGFGYWVAQQARPLPLMRSDAECTVDAEGQVRLDGDQMANAATIAATGFRLDMPERAIVVALATALQESKLRNLPHLGAWNDHDSIGLFQQRPSQGWGSANEISDPRYAAERFYRALSQVRGWQRLRVTDAAQRVQRSAFPEAYEKWAADANVLTDALVGRAGGAVACRVAGGPARSAAADTVRAELSRDWGREAAVTSDSDDAWVRVGADGQRAGWRYAHWLVSYAAALGVTRVHFSDLEWHATSGTWHASDSVRDHVHAELGA